MNFPPLAPAFTNQLFLALIRKQAILFLKVHIIVGPSHLYRSVPTRERHISEEELPPTSSIEKDKESMESDVWNIIFLFINSLLFLEIKIKS
jgi:hypothetical protein